MNRPLSALVGLSAVTLLATSTLSFAAEPSKPPMHMHKSELNHRSEQEAAVEYKSEATQLRETGAISPHVGESVSCANRRQGELRKIAVHCDNLAKFYENAAQEADAIASGLEK